MDEYFENLQKNMAGHRLNMLDIQRIMYPPVLFNQNIFTTLNNYQTYKPY